MRFILITYFVQSDINLHCHIVICDVECGPHPFTTSGKQNMINDTIYQNTKFDLSLFSGVIATLVDSLLEKINRTTKELIRWG